MLPVRTRSPGPARPLLGAAALLAAALAPSAARAQEAGWALDRYEPTPAGETFFAAEHPWYTGADDVTFRAGLTLDYARRPLVLRVTRNGEETVTPVVSDMVVLHAQAAVSLWDRLNVHLSLPFSLYQDGASGSVAGLGAASGASIGDPRLGARVRIFGEADRDPISLHAGGALFINAGALGVGRSSNVTDDGFRGRLNVTLAGRGGPVRWSFGGGVHLRQNTLEYAGTVVGHDLFASAAVGFVALDDRLTIGPELWASTVLKEAFESRHSNLEAVLGAHYLIADTVLVGVAAGPGLSQGAGTPVWRGLAQVAYAPPVRREQPRPPDTDGDGVIDPEDECPTVPMGAHPDPARRGCPLADTDNDGVFDNEDVCVTEPQGPNPDPNRRGCPRGDRDGDGVFDDEDQCVDVPQGPNPDPERRGCPDGDDDRDGVLNSRDQCRAVPQGPFPDPQRPGCPAPDCDCDTVPDTVDRCRTTPGVPSSDPARNGCPNVNVVVHGTQIDILRPVYFATDRDVVLPRSEPVLQAVADVLRAAPYMRRIRVEGHTDDTNTDEYNLDLSQRRANNVRLWLIQHGVGDERLEARGYGESQPVRAVDGLTGRALRDARASNRRVMFIVTETGDGSGGTSGGGGPAAPSTPGCTPTCLQSSSSSSSTSSPSR